jgi:hypothetical protein
MDDKQDQPSMTERESNELTASVPRGCGFGCLYMPVALIGFCILFSLVTPLIFRDNLRAIGQVGFSIGLLVVAPIAGLIGFFRHRRRKAS